VGSAIDEIFWKWEPARKILDPLIRAWWMDGERCPDDLVEIIRERRELWKLAVVQADQAELEAQVAELDRLTRAGFERRRAEAWWWRRCRQVRTEGKTGSVPDHYAEVS
jgi:hypothetical protein